MIALSRNSGTAFVSKVSGALSRSGAALGDVEESASQMGPAKGERTRLVARSVRNRPVSRIPVALHAQEAEVGLRVILFSRRLGRLHCSQWFLRLCELSVKFAVAHRSDQYVDDHGKLVERRNGDCVLALFELNRFRSQPNKEDIGPVRVNPPPGQDALHLIDRRE